MFSGVQTLKPKKRPDPPEMECGKLRIIGNEMMVLEGTVFHFDEFLD